jgi:hypothetical protein
MERRLYGCDYVLNVMKQQKIRTKEYENILNNEFKNRKKLVEDLIDNVSSASMGTHLFQGEEQWKYGFLFTKVRIPFWFLSATHNKETVTKLQDLFQRINIDTKESFLVSFTSILSHASRDDDFILNSVNLHHIINYIFEDQDTFLQNGLFLMSGFIEQKILFLKNLDESGSKRTLLMKKHFLRWVSLEQLKKEPFFTEDKEVVVQNFQRERLCG